MKTKAILISVFIALLMASCIKDYIGHVNDKVDVCHKGKIISINIKALEGHLNHGDISLIDSDGDGYVEAENECSIPSGDCDDKNADVNPGAEEVGDNGIDDNCDGNIDEGCDTSPIYLDANGITIKCYECANVGDTGEINGITYTIVDEAMLRQMVGVTEQGGVFDNKVCTTKVTDMSQMFYNRNNLNIQSISSWDVSNVTNMSGMFGMNWEYFQLGIIYPDMSSWDVSSVTDMSSMFAAASSSFNQDISSWDVSSVTDMSYMFGVHSEWGGVRFNQDISSWDVSKVTNMRGMFVSTPLFNQPLGNWDVSSVTDMSNMFNTAYSFNQDISSWDVSSVTDMSAMFAGGLDPTLFNQDISSWDVSSVTNMSYMFAIAPFNQDLGGWNVDNVIECEGFSATAHQWILPKPNFTNCTE